MHAISPVQFPYIYMDLLAPPEGQHLQLNIQKQRSCIPHQCEGTTFTRESQNRPRWHTHISTNIITVLFTLCHYQNIRENFPAEIFTQFAPYGFSTLFYYWESSLHVLSARESKDGKLSHGGQWEQLVDRNTVDSSILEEALTVFFSFLSAWCWAKFLLL